MIFRYIVLALIIESELRLSRVENLNSHYNAIDIESSRRIGGEKTAIGSDEP